MKIKVIMDSGKEYFDEQDQSISDLIKRILPQNGLGTNYISLDKNKTIYVNSKRISSIEEI